MAPWELPQPFGPGSPRAVVRHRRTQCEHRLFSVSPNSAGSALSLPAGEVGAETKSLLEQLRGEALKFHKPGGCEEALPAGCQAWHRAAALTAPFPQERTTKRRATW